MPVEDNEKPPSPTPVETDGRNFMVEHYNDSRFNAYEEDSPGQALTEQLQETASTDKGNRRDCGIYLKRIPKLLEERGIVNLCSKYGQVKSAKRMDYDNAVVRFATVADAENAIRHINLGKLGGMHAAFQRPKKKSVNEEESNPFLNMPQFQPVDGIPNKFDLPLATPPCLDSFAPKPLLSKNDWEEFEVLRQFDNQPMTILVESENKSEGIKNGSASYRHSPNGIKEMEKMLINSLGSFDAEKQEFVHNGSLEFVETGKCKNCDNSTIKICKGCKDPFCSLYCLKEYNREKSGCSCVSLGKAEIKAKSINYHAARRGGKLISPRNVSLSTLSTSSADSDTKSVGSNPTLQKRHAEQDLNNKLVVITSVVSHQVVFLRSFEAKDNDEYIMHLNDVVESSKTAPPLDEVPQKGDIVLAEYEGCYHRALVARIENKEAVVAFLEFGHLEKKPLTSLKKLRKDLKEKQFIFKANLSGVSGQLKSDKCLAYLYKLLEKEVPLKFVLRNNVSASKDVLCELFVSRTNESVNGKLSTLNNIKPGKVVMENDIPVKTLDASTTEVVVVNNSLTTYGFVAVARPEHMADMFLMHQRIQEYCKDDYDPPYTPQQYEICLAKCNDQWYRARLDKSFGDMNPAMFFIDFVMYNKVHVNYMRPMPSEFNFPLYSSFAQIDGINENTNMETLPDTFRLLSKISVAKIQQDSPDDLKINFNPPIFKPRKLLLERLNKITSASEQTS